MRAKVDEIGAENVAAFICEPVQGSGGVIVPPDGFLSAMQAACRELGILFIIDEVITGFGRTGPMFACEHEGLTPDFMTIAKGLTAGYVPMGAALVSDAVYQVIADAVPDGTPFGHGFTYSGHPVSAAVARAVLKLYREGGLIENGQRVGAYFGERLKELTAHPLVGDVRFKGLLAGIEVVDPGRYGLIFRAFADGTIGLAPPLCITNDEVDMLIDRLTASLDDIIDIRG